MWFWVPGALANDRSDEAAGDDPAGEQAEEDPRSQFSIGVGVSAGRIDEKFVPVFQLGARASSEIGPQRAHLLLLDLDLDLVGTQANYQYTRAALGWDLRTPKGPVLFSVGPRLWVASLSDNTERIVTSPGLSLNTALTLQLGHDWSLYGSIEGGRGTTAAWSTLAPLPLTHAGASVGLRSPLGIGLGLSAQQVGSLQTGLLMFGIGL